MELPWYMAMTGVDVARFDDVEERTMMYHGPSWFMP
jgi:hypothetical protein